MQINCINGYVPWWFQVTLEDGHIEFSIRDSISSPLKSSQTYMDGLLHYVSLINDESGWVEWHFCQRLRTLFSLMKMSSIFSCEIFVFDADIILLVSPGLLPDSIPITLFKKSINIGWIDKLWYIQNRRIFFKKRNGKEIKWENKMRGMIMKHLQLCRKIWFRVSSSLSGCW